MRKLTNKMAIIAIITVFLTPFFHFHALSVRADSTAPADSSISNEEIIPGQVLVKYKHSVQSSSSFGIQSLGPQIQTIHFSESMDVGEKIKQLKLDPNVEIAEPVYKVHAYTTTYNPADGSVSGNVYFNYSDQTYMHNWGKTVTKTTYLQGLTSNTQINQVIVAVIDTGVDMEHPDLKGAKIPGYPGYDFISHDNLPQDDNGHGTNVAGIIAADGGINGIGYYGVAPGAKILPIRVLGADGSGTSDDVIAGIDYAVANHANIINLSLGSPIGSIIMHQAIINAVNAGVLVIAAAGNEGNNYYGDVPGNISDSKSGGYFTGIVAAMTGYPAKYPEVISVGATEQLPNGSIAIADFSNTGKVDVVAPGVNIYSTFSTSVGAAYRYMSGTSQATPSVAGFAALLKANNPSFGVSKLTEMIRNSATPFEIPSIEYSNGILGTTDLYGYGLINAKASYQRPRLNISAATTFTNNNVALNVSTKNYQNILTSDTATVSGSVYQIYEDAVEETFVLKSSPSIYLAGGPSSINMPNPNSSSSYYHYFMYVGDNVNSEQFINSNVIEFLNRPPVPAPASGSGSGVYTGSKTITLTSLATDSIYYSLNGSSFTHYTGPFTITQSSTLYTFGLINHVFSAALGTFNYTINQPTPIPTATPSDGGTNTVIGGGGGGGGFIPFIPPGPAGSPTATPVPTISPTPTPKPSDIFHIQIENGKSNLEVKPNKDNLLKLINTNSSDITVNAKSSDSTDSVSVELDGEVMLQAQQKGKSITISSNDLQVHFAPGTLNLHNTTGNLIFSASIANDESLANNVHSVSTVYNFNLSVGDQAIHTFKEPIEVNFSIDPSKVQNANHLGVFYYNETNQAWEYIGGTVKDNTVTALLPHFSKYAVLENSKTFNDIQSHWAKSEIEEMAAKQIVNGMTEVSFKPEANITRAQFVSLLVRSLRLESSSGSTLFSDIPSNAWYNKDVYAAYNAKIIKGITEQTFAPEAKITREQLATLLVNAYLQKTGKQLSDIVTTQEVYTDEGSISSWARSYVQIATSLSLMGGVGNGKFNPSGFATRAEAAVVLKRFLNLAN
jgi:subtilisin family serine protease